MRPEPPNVSQIVDDMQNAIKDDIVFTAFREDRNGKF